jgi:glycogen debranching enzyme
MPSDSAAADAALLRACHDRSIELLRTNLSPAGILAARPDAAAKERGYAAVFGRDAAICAIGMALSGDAELERAAFTGLATLAEHQAANGQLPKFVDSTHAEADFWYLGCIDSTLWWLIALAYLDRKQPRLELSKTYSTRIGLALRWLEAQEHQRFFLLQQNEASDWADIMPRSGFVLYTNALWYLVKQIFGLGQIQATQHNFNSLFHPFSAELADYRRARLLSDYALQSARNRDLYLSFVNFSFFGEEGDVFGNVLAILLGAADITARRRTLEALIARQIDSPYPVRSVCDPILEQHDLWRRYMARHQQNFAWQYHNGGIWPMLGGFWITALVAQGETALAQRSLVGLARASALNDWEFNEWLHGETHAPSGMPHQSWNAAAFLMAEHAVRTGENPFAVGRISRLA